MSEPVTTEVKQSVFSMSVILFLIPAYLYLCAFQYEKGACDFYMIPRDLITPDLTTNLTYCIAFFGAIYLAYFGPHIFSALFFYEKAKKNEAIFPFIRANCMMILVGYFAFSTITYPIDWLRTAELLLIPITIVNLMAFWQYLYIKDQLKAKPYQQISKEWNKVVNIPETILAMPDVLNLRWTVFKNIKMPQPTVLLILFAIVWWSYSIGVRDAYQKTTYEISADKKGWVLLRKYGDDLILKNYDLKTKQLGDSLLIIKVSSTIPVKLVSKNLGNLHSSGTGDF